MQQSPLQTHNSRPSTNNNYSNNAKYNASNRGPGRPQRYRQNNVSMLSSTTPIIDNLVTVKGKINSHACEFVLDSAANVSVVSDKLVTRLNLYVEPVTTKINIADDRPTHSYGMTRAVKIEIHGTTCNLQLLVRPLPDNVSILLGLDWFRITNSFVDTVDRILSFKKREIKLNENEQVDVSECFVTEALLEEDDINLDQQWSQDSDSTFQVSTDGLESKEAELLQNLILNHQYMFADSYGALGCCTLGNHIIKTTSENPIFLHPYRKSQSERIAMKTEIAKMLEADIIRP